MTLHPSNKKKEEMKKNLERLYAYATTDLSKEEINELVKLMEQTEGKLLLWLYRMED